MLSAILGKLYCHARKVGRLDSLEFRGCVDNMFLWGDAINFSTCADLRLGAKIRLTWT